MSEINVRLNSEGQTEMQLGHNDGAFKYSADTQLGQNEATMQMLQLGGLVAQGPAQLGGLGLVAQIDTEAPAYKMLLKALSEAQAGFNRAIRERDQLFTERTQLSAQIISGKRENDELRTALRAAEATISYLRGGSTSGAESTPSPNTPEIGPRKLAEGGMELRRGSSGYGLRTAF